MKSAYNEIAQSWVSYDLDPYLYFAAQAPYDGDIVAIEGTMGGKL